MMLALVPAWMVPTVMTAASNGETSRETIVCSARTVRAAITTGSIVVSGRAPWPPAPKIVTRMVSLLLSTGPAR